MTIYSEYIGYECYFHCRFYFCLIIAFALYRQSGQTYKSAVGHLIPGTGIPGIRTLVTEIKTFGRAAILLNLLPGSFNFKNRFFLIN